MSRNFILLASAPPMGMTWAGRWNDCFQRTFPPSAWGVREAVRRIVGDRDHRRLHLGGIGHHEAIAPGRGPQDPFATGFPDFEAYLAHVEREPSRREFTEMVDALTTNKTSFFREHAHFGVLRDDVLPACPGPVRLWSAGCSSGEEAYTLAMVLHDALGPAASSARILATDISHRVLATATAGVYPATTLADVPSSLRQQYWRPSPDGTRLEAAPALRALVRFGRLNLMAAWPMRGPFDAIFCRNVMIYFDKATQQALVERFRQLLRPGGYLFVGHSESLTGLTHQFRYVQPAVYAR